jgi:hypothetical protein
MYILYIVQCTCGYLRVEGENIIWARLGRSIHELNIRHV